MTKTTTTTITETFDKDGKLTEKITETRIEESDNVYYPSYPTNPWNPIQPYSPIYTTPTAPCPNPISPIITCNSNETKV